MTNSRFSSPIITLVLIGVVVARFFFREFRDQKVSLRTMFVPPIILLVLAVWLMSIAFGDAPQSSQAFVIEGIVATLVGCVVGIAVSHYTTVRMLRPGIVVVRGSVQTLIIWLAALAARFLVRFLIKDEGQGMLMGMNAALVFLIGAALAVRRYRIFIDARRLAAEGSLAEERVI